VMILIKVDITDCWH